MKIKSNWNAKSFEPIYKNFTSGKALTWLRIKKMDMQATEVKIPAVKGISNQMIIAMATKTH